MNSLAGSADAGALKSFPIPAKVLIAVKASAPMSSLPPSDIIKQSFVTTAVTDALQQRDVDARKCRT